MNEQQVMRDVLGSWDEDVIGSHHLRDKICLTYSLRRPRGVSWPYGFDAEIDGEISVFYLLHIQLPDIAQGQGFGAMLYDCCTEIAERLGCLKIEQYPSGWTTRGEPRRDYLLRRGWLLCESGDSVYKPLREYAT